MMDLTNQQFGQYRLLRQIGEGGFAEVWLGEHVELETKAAIKVLHSRLGKDDVADFRREARTVAQLRHPNIVRVLDFGVQDHIPYLVMDYAPNGTLRTRHPKGTQVPLAAVRYYARQIADGLQFAHDQQPEHIVHRDVKPENMLLGDNHVVLISDFGIAAATQSSRIDETQAVAGTIAYMAPEQIQGRPRPQSDQYSLGIVIYEWLTGTRPFQGSFIEISAQHINAQPPRLQEKLVGISPALEQVILTALEKDYHNRFGSMRAFANAFDLACRTAEPTIALPPGSGWLPGIPTPHPSQPQVPTVPPGGLISPGILAEPPRVSATPPPPEVGETLLTHEHEEGAVLAVAWSPDGTRLASADAVGQVHIWEAATDTTIATYAGHASAAVRCVAWSPDGLLIASAGADKTVQVWNAATATEVFNYAAHSAPVYAVAWSPDGARIASAGEDRVARVWNRTTGREVTAYREHSGTINALAWSPNGTRLTSASSDGVVRLWNADDGITNLVYREHKGAAVLAMAWSPDGKWLASGDQRGIGRVWNATSGNNRAVFYGHHSNEILCLSWAPDGRYLASGSADKSVQVWEEANGNRAFTYEGHADRVRGVAWAPDGTRIASASGDGTVAIWQISPVPESEVVPAPPPPQPPAPRPEPNVIFVPVPPPTPPPRRPPPPAQRPTTQESHPVFATVALSLLLIDPIACPILIGLANGSWVSGLFLFVGLSLAYWQGVRGYIPTLLSILFAWAWSSLFLAVGSLFSSPVAAYLKDAKTENLTWEIYTLTWGGAALGFLLHLYYFKQMAKARKLQGK